jgi:type II secretory pathway pseudopilin PulG
MKGANRRSGFTIIEMTLATTFVSMLLISIVILTMRMTDIYTKGRTIRDVTTVGRALINDFQNTVGSSPSPAGSRIDYLVRDNVEGLDGSGRFCTGTFSYLWNTGAKLQEKARNDLANTATSNLITYDGAPVRLLKIPDASKSYCNPPAVTDGERVNALQQATDADGVELINASEVNLAIYQLVANSVTDTYSTSQGLYNISFILGTMSNVVTAGSDGSIDIANKRCTAPADAPRDFNYCAINKFDLTIRASGNVTN